MADRLRFTILGCGSSPGVPRIGDDWGACDPRNPRNRRRRASLLVQRIGPTGITTVVVDTGPDFRSQMLDAGIGELDGVIYTHAHADHTHGIDDLRSFVINQRRRVRIWCDTQTSARLHEAFDYCFTTPSGSNYPPILRENRIEDDISFTIDGLGGPIDVLPYRHAHGQTTSLGFRFANVAYSSDVSSFSDEAYGALEDLDTLVLDALQYRTHPSHLSIEQALKVIERCAPRRAYLTHMHTPLDYDEVLRNTPQHVEPGYDGLVFETSVP